MAKKSSLKSNSKSKQKKYQASQGTGPQQVADYLMGTLTLIYVFVMLVIYPLYYHNKYYDMGDSKYQFFITVSLIFLGLLSVSWIVWMVAYRKEKNYSALFKTWSKTDYLAVAFLLITFLSFLLSRYKDTALWGYSGWYMGLMSQLVFVLTYLYISRYWSYSPFTMFSIVAAAALVYGIGVLQRFSIDPLNMYEDLGPEYIEKFISTLGQTTWYTSYAVLILPFGMFFYCYGKKLWVKIASGLFTALGFAMICTTNSDSAYIAIVLILMVFFWFSLENNEQFLKFWQVLLIGLATFRLIGLLQNWFPESKIEHVWETEALTEIVVHSRFMLVLLGIVLILNVVFYLLYAPIKDSKNPKAEAKAKYDVSKIRFLRYVMLIAAAAAVLIVILLMVLVTKGKLPASLSALAEIDYLYFVDAWGNHRGFNWRMALTAFSHASVKDILFGVGPDCFADAMDTYCAQEVAVYWQGLQLACAHNEYLNMLVTEGLLGVLSYLGIFLFSFLRMNKYASKDKMVIPVMAAIVAYIGHNFFCYQQCITTATIFVILGIGEYLARQAAKE